MKILVLLLTGFYLGFVAGVNWRHIHRGDKND